MVWDAPRVFHTTAANGSSSYCGWSAVRRKGLGTERQSDLQWLSLGWLYWQEVGLAAVPQDCVEQQGRDH
jgi:hypothetical protein